MKKLSSPEPTAAGPPGPGQAKRQRVDELAASLGCDVIVYAGPIDRTGCERLAKECCQRQRRRERVMLIVATFGGDPDAAYWIGRTLQAQYTKISAFVPGYCKSAGTLVALAAHELVISDLGELGPLDVQRAKKDHLWETESGLTVGTALRALQANVWAIFEEYFLRLERSSGGALTVQTAAQIAATLTSGLIGPIAQQIDPKQVGESSREMMIAREYGLRLIAESGSANEDSLDRLVQAYPTHGFVIDRREASELFENVRAPSEDEEALLALLNLPGPDERSAVVGYVTREIAAQPQEPPGVPAPATDHPGGPDGPDGNSPHRAPTEAAGASEPRRVATGAVS